MRVNYKICVILLCVSLGLYPLADACQDDGIPQDPESCQAGAKSRREEDHHVSCSAYSLSELLARGTGGPSRPGEKFEANYVRVN